jgi:hypothetical protein
MPGNAVRRWDSTAHKEEKPGIRSPTVSKDEATLSGFLEPLSKVVPALDVDLKFTSSTPSGLLNSVHIRDTHSQTAALFHQPACEDTPNPASWCDTFSQVFVEVKAETIMATSNSSSIPVELFENICRFINLYHAAPSAEARLAAFIVRDSPSSTLRALFCFIAVIMLWWVRSLAHSLLFSSTKIQRLIHRLYCRLIGLYSSVVLAS